MRLEVQQLSLSFSIDGLWYPAVEDLSFTIERGKTLCLVGESGCGKSVTALSILGLLPKSNTRINRGSVRLENLDLTSFNERELQSVRGKRISMIFQEPGTSLNPVFTIGAQLSESLRIHKNASRSEAKARAIEMMKEVGISSAEERYDQYPHEMSGGMKQRVMIAMALLCEPEFLIADEPTTALDVTIQAQILDLIRKLQKDRGMGVILISHDLGIVAEMADEVAVMYAGMIVERAPVEQLFTNPMHPYTRALAESIPETRETEDRSALSTIPGRVPALVDFPSHCRFADRCSIVQESCKKAMPTLRPLSDSHFVRCDLV